MINTRIIKSEVTKKRILYTSYKTIFPKFFFDALGMKNGDMINWRWSLDKPRVLLVTVVNKDKENTETK